MISLRPLKDFHFPIAAECISPDAFESKTCTEIENLTVWEGNKQRKLGDLFKIEESKAEVIAIAICGDVSKVRRIGSCMTKGELAIRGNAGMHLGEKMKGGKISVHGNVEGWAGSTMKDGAIEIYGNAGDYLGAPYRGSTEGMRGGSMVIHGNVGCDAGAHMRNGMIKIHGSSGEFTGFRMCEGTIYVEGDAGRRAGACMVGGKIVVNGFLEDVLPTFTIDSIKPKVKIEENQAIDGPFYVFLGDLVENGNGKLYIRKEKNPQLGHYEKLL